MTGSKICDYLIFVVTGLMLLIATILLAYDKLSVVSAMLVTAVWIISIFVLDGIASSKRIREMRKSDNNDLVKE